MPTPNEKTTAWTPIETGDPAREATLAQAYLLCQRRKYDDAKRLLHMLQRSAPQDPDVQYLLARIASTEVAEKQEDEGLRSWRYRLGMQTSTARFCAYVAAVVIGIYGIWNFFNSIGEGISKGFGTNISSLIYTGGRYRSRYFEWNRLIYVDTVYGLTLTAAAIVIVFVVYRISRDAAMWEEIGDMNIGSRW